MEKIKRRKSEKIALWGVFCIFTIYALTLIYPFFWAFMNSLKDSIEYFDLGSFGWPTRVVWANYADAFRDIKIGSTDLIGMFANSIIYSLGGTVISVFVSAMTAYVLVYFKFKGRGLIYGIALFIMIIPIVGSLPASYRLISNLNLKNNLFGIMILYTAGFGFNFFMLYGCFKSVSWSYAEAAYIDGASHFLVFLRIMLPQAKSAMFAVGVVQFIGIWNDYLTPFLYLEKVPTLSLGLYQFKELMVQQGANYPVYLAAVILATIPIIAIFAVFQKTIMENTVAGGLKG